MTVYSAYDQIADLPATVDPAKILALKASGKIQERVEYLVEKAGDELLNKREKMNSIITSCWND